MIITSIGSTLTILYLCQKTTEQIVVKRIANLRKSSRSPLPPTTCTSPIESIGALNDSPKMNVSLIKLRAYLESESINIDTVWSDAITKNNFRRDAQFGSSVWYAASVPALEPLKFAVTTIAASFFSSLKSLVSALAPR